MLQLVLGATALEGSVMDRAARYSFQDIGSALYEYPCRIICGLRL